MFSTPIAIPITDKSESRYWKFSDNGASVDYMWGVTNNIGVNYTPYFPDQPVQKWHQNAFNAIYNSYVGVFDMTWIYGSTPVLYGFPGNTDQWYINRSSHIEAAGHSWSGYTPSYIRGVLCNSNNEK